MKTLKQHIQECLDFVKENPGLEEALLVYSKDDEGNDFNLVGDWGLTAGHWDGKAGEFLQEAEFSNDDILINAVCIN